MDDEEVAMQPVSGSTAIIAAGYGRGVIRLTWVNGRTYDYPGSDALWRAFQQSRSKGRFARSLGDGVEV